MITVVNKRTHAPTEHDVYIGRGSKLGNPYSHTPGTKAEHLVGSREEAVALYELWLKQKIQEKDSAVCKALNYIYFKAHYRVNLVCFCSPLLCHGHVLKRVIESKLKKVVSQ